MLSAPKPLPRTETTGEVRWSGSGRSISRLALPLALFLSLAADPGFEAQAAPEPAQTTGTASSSRNRRPERASRRKSTSAEETRSSREPAKRPAVSGDKTVTTRTVTTTSETTLPAALAAAPPPATASSVDLDTAVPGTVLPPVPEETTSTDLILRLDQALAEVGWDPSLSAVTEAGIEESTATALLAEVQNLLPDTPLPEKELDALTSTSRGAVRVTLMDSLCRTLQANQQLNVERLQPEISNTGIESALSEFDTTLQAGGGIAERRSSTLGPRPRRGDIGDREEDTRITRNQDFDIGISGRLPTGTNYSLGYNTNRNVTDLTEPFYSSALNLNITQNLLRGAGSEVNLVRVRAAQNNFVRSLYTLQQFLNDLITDVQIAYYDLYLAAETLRIRRQAYAVARQQREQVEQFVAVGRSAPLEALSAQAEEASRISDVINAAADLRRQQLEFLRLINPSSLREGWRTRIFPLEPPIIPSEKLVPEQHVKLAQRYRPDLRQSEIDLANGELEVLRTENGLLPVLDFVSELGTSGVGDTAGSANSSAFGGDFGNYRFGFQFSYPLQNRSARAADRRARFEVTQAQQAILNLQQLIEVDVRTAIIEIDRTRRLIDSTAVTRRLREAELAAELEKFRVGRSTQLLVNQAQRDLTTAQLQEVSARVAHIRAYLQLYRADGTVLQRRGIQPIWISPTSGVPSP